MRTLPSGPAAHISDGRNARAETAATPHSGGMFSGMLSRPSREAAEKGKAPQRGLSWCVERAICATCPKCGSGRRPRRYGDISASYRDAPFLGRQVTITVNVRRFRCHDCGQAFFQDLTDMDGRRRMTARCVTYVIDQVMTRSSLRDVAQVGRLPVSRNQSRSVTTIASSTTRGRTNYSTPCDARGRGGSFMATMPMSGDSLQRQS